MACEPFDCNRCGQRHERCTGHVDKDDTGNPIPIRPCLKWPRKGAPVCQKHGGDAKQVVQAAEQRVQEAKVRAAITRLGQPIPEEEATPAEVLLGLVREAAGNVEFYRSLVGELPTHPTPPRRDTVGGDDLNGLDDSGKAVFVPGDPGIYGPTYHQSGIPTGEAKPHVLVVMYDQERDRLARYVKEALAAEIEERRIRLAEADARVLMGAVVAGLKRAKVPPEQAEEFRRGFADFIREAGHPGLTGGPA